mmetsp:Transcript_105862/g.287340  ORF Transcript_105862/g.287340 Transcript_105862/m.287340 type:complete len:357 (-) Transcript_105862:730-1800(-)
MALVGADARLVAVQLPVNELQEGASTCEQALGTVLDGRAESTDQRRVILGRERVLVPRQHLLKSRVEVRHAVLFGRRVSHDGPLARPEHLGRGRQQKLARIHAVRDAHVSFQPGILQVVHHASWQHADEPFCSRVVRSQHVLTAGVFHPSILLRRPPEGRDLQSVIDRVMFLQRPQVLDEADDQLRPVLLRDPDARETAAARGVVFQPPRVPRVVRQAHDVIALHLHALRAHTDPRRGHHRPDLVPRDAAVVDRQQGHEKAVLDRGLPLPTRVRLLARCQGAEDQVDLQGALGLQQEHPAAAPPTRQSRRGELAPARPAELVQLLEGLRRRVVRNGVRAPQLIRVDAVAAAPGADR